jgi:hypothetical protein
MGITETRTLGDHTIIFPDDTVLEGRRFTQPILSSLCLEPLPNGGSSSSSTRTHAVEPTVGRVYRPKTLAVANNLDSVVTSYSSSKSR